MLAVILAAVACAEGQQSTDTLTTAVSTPVATAVKRSPTPTTEGQQSADTATTTSPTPVATAFKRSLTPRGEGQQSTDTATTTSPTPVATASRQFRTPTVEPTHPALEEAKAALKHAVSFRFLEHLKLSTHHGPAFGSAEGGFEAIGNYQSTGNFTKSAGFPDYANRQTIQVHSLSLRHEKYLTDPATGEWVSLHDELSLSYDYKRFLFSSPVERFFSVVREGDPYDYRGIINLDGVRVHHFVSTQLRSNSVRSDGPLHIEIWIGVDDLLVRKVTRSYSWEDNYCNGAEICPEILIIPGSEFYSLQLSFPGDKTPIVAPPQGEAETFEGPFGPMASSSIYTSLSPSSIPLGGGVTFMYSTGSWRSSGIATIAGEDSRLRLSSWTSSAWGLRFMNVPSIVTSMRDRRAKRERPSFPFSNKAH